MDIHGEVNKIVKKKQGKYQLNSGNLPKEDYEFYRDLAARRGTPISVGVSEALHDHKPILAEKYDMNKCPQCRQSVEQHHLFCWHCGKRVKSDDF